MHYYSRIPAVLTLLAVLGLGSLPLFARRPASSVAAEAQLAELQVAIAQPDVNPAVWMEYAQTLQALKRYPQAVLAYRRFLEHDPYNRQAMLQCAVSLCAQGNRDEFFAFGKTILACDPKLALDILDRPDVQPFMVEPRFVNLRKEASAQSMD